MSKKVSILWLEIILIALLVIGALGIWTFVDQWVTQDLKSQEPSLEQFQQQEQLSTLQRKFKASQDELIEIKKAFVKQSIELELQNSKVKALIANYSELSSSSTESGEQPKKIFEIYEKALLEQTTAKNSVDSLKLKTSKLEKLLATQSNKLFEIQEKTSEKLEEEKNSYTRRKKINTLKGSFGIVLAFTVVFCLILLLLQHIKKEKLKIKVGLIFISTLTLQLTLLGAQAFGALGAVLVLLFFLLVAVIITI